MTYSGTKVLVTGADGFIGSHLVDALVRAGASVSALCLYNSFGSRGWLDGLSKNVSKEIDFRLGDIRDSRLVEQACSGMDVCFHLAALIAIPYSYEAPESFVDTNIRGTLNVLEAVRREKCGRLVNTSTSEVYGTPDELPIRETHPLRAQSPYAASKIAADKLCESYNLSFGTPVVVLRPFNTYGPRQSARAVIPTILAQLLAGAKQVELGSLEPRRDLTFISDTVRGFLAAGKAEGILGKTIHLGTGRAESVADIFHAACAAVGVEAEAVVNPQRVRPHSSEVMVLQSDPTIAGKLLDWKAEVRLEQGLAKTAEWMRGELSRYRPEWYAR
jgi:UDP-glucose 4-epimerase